MCAMETVKRLPSVEKPWMQFFSEEAQNAEPQMPDGQNVPQEQEGMPDWSGTPFEDFFRYFFGS